MGILSEFLARKDLERQNVEARGLVQGLLGEQPTGGDFAADDFGPPTPLEGGSGLLADINDPNRQATFAAGLLGNQLTRSSGASLLGGVFADQGAMDRLRVSNAAARSRAFITQDTSFANAAARLQQEAAHFNRTFQQKAETERLKREQTQRQNLLAKPEAGFARVADPNSPLGFEDVMIPGSKSYQSAQGAAIETRDSVGLVDELITMVIDSTGPESFGERAGRAVGIQGQLLSKVLQIRGFGAPQAAEMEFLFKQIPDLSSLTSRIGWEKKSEFVGALMELRGEFDRSFTMQQQMHQGSQIPELGTGLGASPSEVLKRAKELGLRQRSRESFEQRPFLQLPPGESPESSFIGGS